MGFNFHCCTPRLLRLGLLVATFLPVAALSTSERRPYIESCGGLLLLDSFIEMNFGPNDQPNLRKLFEARDMLLDELIHDPMGQNIPFGTWAASELQTYVSSSGGITIPVSYQAAAKLHYMSRISGLRSEKIAFLALKHGTSAADKYPEFSTWDLNAPYYFPRHSNILARHQDIKVPNEFVARILGTQWNESFLSSSSTEHRKLIAFTSIAVTKAVDSFFANCDFTFAPGRDYWTPTMETRIFGAAHSSSQTTHLSN